MPQIQDEFFAKRYFQPAMGWADQNGFTQPLSALVVYDSFTHSGSVPEFLRKRFAERVPAREGIEKTWVQQYVDTRK
ncbi:MAG TPA: chitosanase [Candidatus Binatia bacterium]